VAIRGRHSYFTTLSQRRNARPVYIYKSWRKRKRGHRDRQSDFRGAEGWVLRGCAAE